MDQSEVVAFKFRIRLLGATLIFAIFLGVGCGRRSHPDDRIRLTDTPNAKPAQTLSQIFPPCPGASASVLSDTHKIVLTWNPSTSLSGRNDPSIRYCVYRSDKAIHVSRRLKCPSCKTITPISILGTSCMDNFGEGTKTYYYAVTAINAAGESGFSNKITARLNRQQTTSSAANRQAPQLCRAPTGAKTAPEAVSGPEH